MLSFWSGLIQKVVELGMQISTNSEFTSNCILVPSWLTIIITIWAFIWKQNIFFLAHWQCYPTNFNLTTNSKWSWEIYFHTNYQSMNIQFNIMCYFDRPYFSEITIHMLIGAFSHVVISYTKLFYSKIKMILLFIIVHTVRRKTRINEPKAGIFT